ncbi:hypothetical protein [Candidatus Spongiihabitans sp.]
MCATHIGFNLTEVFRAILIARAKGRQFVALNDKNPVFDYSPKKDRV